jgi:hypothetical protein
MGTGAVHNHNDEFILMCLTDLFQKLIFQAGLSASPKATTLVRSSSALQAVFC